MNAGVSYLLDANVVSEMMKTNPDDRVSDFLDYSLHEEGIGLAVITVWEILNGIGLLPAGKRRENTTYSFEAVLSDYFTDRIIDWTVDDATACADVMERKRKAGEPLDDHFPDAMLAGIALNRSLVIATRNEREFRNTGVEIINPWKQPATR